MKKIKNVTKTIIKLPFSKKEDGSSGLLNYVWYFIAIIICIVIFAYNRFNIGLYVVESIVENGIHIAESGSVAMNMREDEFLTKVHMIPAADDNPDSSLSTEEETEVKKIANAFSDRFKNQLDLNDNANPTKGTLAGYCGTDSKILITEFTLVEPVYEIIVERHEIPVEEDPEENPEEEEEDGDEEGAEGEENPEEEEDPDMEFIKNDYDFTIRYEIIGWKKYPVYFSNNHLSSIGMPQFTTTPPMLKNGNQIEGATIEATVELSFSGVKNIFANASEGGIFTNNPTAPNYHVSVTQAFDIVTVDNDSRN